MSKKPRKYTHEECRRMFIDALLGAARYWATAESDDGSKKTSYDRLEGLIFSTLVILDGGTMELPAFDLVPSPHPEDDDEWPCPKGADAEVLDRLAINRVQLYELLGKVKAGL